MGLREVETMVVEGSIRPDEPVDKLRNAVLSGDVLILKSVFDPGEAADIREAVFGWGSNTSPVNTTFDEAESSFHRIDDNPEESDCPHVFHSYNFVFEGATDGIETVVQPYFEKLRELQNELAETQATFDTSTSPYLHPQVIHYPAGGGGFSMHSHPFLPQKMGLILSLSEYGTDYESGGTRFATPDNEIVDIEGTHTVGDVAVFRYDLPHEVTPCDPGADLWFDDSRGRWSMILPYY